MNRKDQILADALQAALDHIGLGHMEDEPLRICIERGLDGPKGITKGGGAVTLRLRAALRLLKAEGQQTPLEQEEDDRASA